MEAYIGLKPRLVMFHDDMASFDVEFADSKDIAVVLARSSLGSFSQFLDQTRSTLDVSGYHRKLIFLPLRTLQSIDVHLQTVEKNVTFRKMPGFTKKTYMVVMTLGDDDLFLIPLINYSRGDGEVSVDAIGTKL